MDLVSEFNLTQGRPFAVKGLMLTDRIMSFLDLDG